MPKYFTKTNTQRTAVGRKLAELNEFISQLAVMSPAELQELQGSETNTLKSNAIRVALEEISLSGRKNA